MATVPRRPRVFLVAGGRRLLAVVRPDQAFVEYAIRTNASEPWAVRDTVKRKLMASTANFGMATGVTPQGFYTMLRENGVSYYPSMWVDGEQILSGKVAMDAPPNRFINGTSKNFQHKLYKHSDLVKDKKMPAKNITTNATVTEPSFVMANRSTNTAKSSTPQETPTSRGGWAPWMTALIVLGALTVFAALGGSLWRCHKERKARQAEEDAGQSEPLSPHSIASHAGHPGV